ncbi:PREDICTED: keratin, type I cytoskeletal 19-like [Nanorana parkeri]|uniref:keratin, type I cytoskeletal 19-like n=1 Tax=Nanorana parkeri TaxID=125878 RepID=UPI000854944A|nr:PREDICTED: keratin, type I cytoskeletal 19-like [Nanorana parkeri]
MNQTVKQVKSGSTQGRSQASSYNQTVRRTGSVVSYHGGRHQAQHGGHIRAPSVHGGSGGKGISISRHFSHGHSFGSVHGSSHGNHFVHQSTHGVFKNDGLLSFNEKETMQLLNNRLATYMDTVCTLEQENSQLERNIREWYEKNEPNGLPDCNKYYRTIQELQRQISEASIQNAKVFLDMDNAKLAADDLLNKYELESNLRNSIESDVKGLHRVLERLNMEMGDLQMCVCNLQEELQELRKTHEEEVNCLRTQLGARVSVEVNAAPCKDLNNTLSKIRQEYENLMDRNLNEVEAIFLARSEELNSEMVFGSEQIQSVSSDLIELKRRVQTLEIELQSQLSVKLALEDSLAETEASYQSQLAQLQCLINNIESELGQTRFDLEQQNTAYKILMDQKNHLEMEIATYKHLLEGHHIHASVHSNNTEIHHGVKVQLTKGQVHQANVQLTKAQVHQAKC